LLFCDVGYVAVTHCPKLLSFFNYSLYVVRTTGEKYSVQMQIVTCWTNAYNCWYLNYIKYVAVSRLWRLKNPMSPAPTWGFAIHLCQLFYAL